MNEFEGDDVAAGAVSCVLAYLWDDEQKHYCESGHSKGHIFESLQVLNALVHTQEESNCGADNCPLGARE